MPVHLYGLPVDIDGFRQVAKDRGLLLLEDAAQAHGATVNGTRVGGFGTTATWSFYPGKNLGALGDAGAITTDDAALAKRLRRVPTGKALGPEDVARAILYLASDDSTGVTGTSLVIDGGYTAAAEWE